MMSSGIVSDNTQTSAATITPTPQPQEDKNSNTDSEDSLKKIQKIRERLKQSMSQSMMVDLKAKQ